MDTIGKYQVIREIGRGGMGKVLQAVDPVMKRSVALKVRRWSEFDEPQRREEYKKQLLRVHIARAVRRALDAASGSAH